MKHLPWFSRAGWLAGWLLPVAVALAADAPKPVDVRVATPGRGTIHRFVTLPGTLKANQQATLHAKVGGYLKSIKVDKGDTVKAGDLLAVIDVPELEAERIRYQAEGLRAKASAGQYAAEEKAAAIELKRLTEAQKKSPDLVTAQAVDDARAAGDIAKARQGTARAEQDVAAAQLKRVETQLAFAKITAPFSGVVTARFVDEGAFIPAATGGSAAGTTAILTLADFNTVRAQVPVPSVEAARVQAGQPVRVTIEGVAGKTFDAQVSRHSFAVDEATQTLLVEADLPNADRQLRPGMFAIIKVGVEMHANALTIPVEALVMEKANAFVFLNAGGKAKKTAIKVGFNDGAKVEVLGGLTGNEPVILAGKLALADGAAVNVTEAK
jgi:membrane fusion protein (multidrug efflux system)